MNKQINLKISGISNLGQGFAMYSSIQPSPAQNNQKNKKIFVSKTLIGDQIEAQIIKENSKFIVANLIKITSPSPNRATPPCQYFANCGGCGLQHLTQNYYQDFKQKILLDLFAREQIDFDGKIDWSFIEAGLRRRVNLQIDHNNRLGFFRENSNDVVKIDNCLILTDEISVLIKPLQQLVQDISYKITQIFITKFDNGIAIILQTSTNPSLEVSDKLTDFAKQNNIISLAYKINDNYHLIYQTQIPQLAFGEIKINLEADIFLQATKEGQNIIVDEINNLVATLQNHYPEKTLNIIDFYCGIGTYSFAVLSKNQKVQSIHVGKSEWF